jgi:hypothetical protein
MSDVAHAFDAPRGRTLLLLPFPLDDAIASLGRLQRRMIRVLPPAFTREEWAYLISFLSPENLQAPFTAAFGHPAAIGGPYERVARPRGRVALWLPNNVSLLGPLTLILLSLTGNQVQVKAGSRAEDLATAFIRWGREADEGVAALFERIAIEQFDRHDPRNAAMAAAAHVRLTFGSDASARSIDTLPHPLDSVGFSFADRQSEAWIDVRHIDDDTLRTVAKVFAIYGTAGCTSPRRLVVIGGTGEDAARVRDGLARLWPEVVTRDVPPHLASQNIMAAQVANATGWHAVTAGRNAAAIAAGRPSLPPPPGELLPVVSATVGEAVASMPANIQTLGTALEQIENVLPYVTAAGVKRIVPISQMHHFGALWDGWNYWHQTFVESEVRQ